MKIKFPKIKLPKVLRENKFLKGKKNFVIPIACLIGVVIVLFILEEAFGSFSITFYGQGIIRKNTNEILTLQKQLKKEQGIYREILDKEAKLIAQKQEYWIIKRDGDINQSFQEKISGTAKKAKVELSTAGSVQVSKVSDDLSIGEVEISCSGDMEEITRFLYAMTYSTPKMYWERFSLRPDNYNNKGVIYMTCDVKFMIVSNDKILQLFGIGVGND